MLAAAGGSFYGGSIPRTRHRAAYASLLTDPPGRFYSNIQGQKPLDLAVKCLFIQLNDW